MKRLSLMLVIGSIFMAQSVSAGTKTFKNVKVQMLSVWSSNGGILLQTSPRHSLEGLDCTSDYWLQLNKNAEGYEAMLAMLLTAQQGQKEVSVAATDGAGEFCSLTRVITFE